MNHHSFSGTIRGLGPQLYNQELRGQRSRDSTELRSSLPSLSASDIHHTAASKDPLTSESEESFSDSLTSYVEGSLNTPSNTAQPPQGSFSSGSRGTGQRSVSVSVVNTR